MKIINEAEKWIESQVWPPAMSTSATIKSFAVYLDAQYELVEKFDKEICTDHPIDEWCETLECKPERVCEVELQWNIWNEAYEVARKVSEKANRRMIDAIFMPKVEKKPCGCEVTRMGGNDYEIYCKSHQPSKCELVPCDKCLKGGVDGLERLCRTCQGTQYMSKPPTQPIEFPECKSEKCANFKDGLLTVIEGQQMMIKSLMESLEAKSKEQ